MTESERSNGLHQPRITVDTNLFVSGLIRTGTPPNLLLRAWMRRLVRVVTTPELRNEVMRVIRRPKFDRYDIDAQLMAAVLAGLNRTELVEPLTELPIHCRDPKDDKVLACALAARVDFIVTGDDDLLDLAGHPALDSTRIVTVREFLSLLGQIPHEPEP